jgi:DNA polymerase/3'-5' exonuclease PolX
MVNKDISQIFAEIIKLLELKGDKALNFKIRAYKKAIGILDNLKVDMTDIYKEKGLKGITELGIGEKNVKKIEEFIKNEKIKDFEELKEETAIQNIIAHYFQTKGIGLQELKNNAKKRKIIYSRFTKPAKQLLELAGSVEKAKKAITTVSQWAKTRKLDYAIETVFKKWLELDQLKPKEIVKKPFYKGNPMIWSEAKKKWFVIKNSEWLEYVGKKEDIEWRIVD